MKSNLLLTVAGLLLGVFGTPVIGAAPPTVVAASDVVWEDLNPARGDQSPRAGTLYGDRNGEAATGFLLAPTDGFESPPHIHNVSYRGVVLQGEFHNDDPSAAQAWLPAGSFWTQPAGEVHITAARGANTLAYIEIDSGPYLVRPVDAAVDNGERPVQLHPSNLVWVDPPGGAPVKGLQVAYLWGAPNGPGKSGAFVRLAAGTGGTVRSIGAGLGVVVVHGAVAQPVAGSVGGTLEQGSFLQSTGTSPVQLTCSGSDACVVYVRAEGGFMVEGG